MATIPFSTDTDRGEARFFFTMACVMAATIIAGFSLNIIVGRSNFDEPWLVHFHAWLMMAFLGLYVAQNALIFGDNVALHRRLGWLSVLFIPAMLVLGTLITRFSIQSHGGPPFFDVNDSSSATRCSSVRSAPSPRPRCSRARTPDGTAG